MLTTLPRAVFRRLVKDWRDHKHTRFGREMEQLAARSEVAMIVKGWDHYAEEWSPEKRPTLDGYRSMYIGDEWTAEDVSSGGTSYGLDPDTIANFDDHIQNYLLNPYLPSYAQAGMEIGPGGGRITALLVSRTGELHLAEPSKAMLQHLKQRFSNRSTVLYHLTDGITLPKLSATSLDYVIAFDVFVHFEPRLIYWYLKQIADLLKKGGTGIIHYANITTPLGWRQFETDLHRNVQKRTSYCAFGVMCSEMMVKFLESLGLEVVSANVGILPRDAIAVFRKPTTHAKSEPN